MTDIVRTRGSLTSAGADRLLELATAAAAAAGLQQCLAVVDESGHLLSFRRMDGAGVVSIEVAIGKARSAAHVQQPSGEFESAIDSGTPSLLGVPALVSLRGGLPVEVNGEIVGAIGVSGATGEVDEQIAAQAISGLRVDG